MKVKVLVYIESLSCHNGPFKIHKGTSISVWMCFMITEVHCQSTKMLTNDVYNVRLATDMYVHTVDKKRRNGRFLK